MPLGRPAIPDPRALELRSIAGAISNIRQRIEAIEAAVSTNALTAAASSVAIASSAQLSTLRTLVTALASRVDGLSEGASDDVTLTAAAAIAAFAPVVAAGPAIGITADANDPSTMFALIGVALSAAAAGAQVVVRRRGMLAGITGVVFETGRAVYVGDLGLTQTPSYESTAIPVGVATGVDSMWVSPDWPALSTVPFASAVDDEFLRYLPVTYRIVRDAVELLEAFNAQPNGILVKTDANTVASRVLVASSGDNITIENNDGVDDDPVFHVPDGDAPSLAYSDGTVPAGNTVANTTVETALASAYTVPAGTLRVGSVLRVKLFGVYSTAIVAPMLTGRLKLGGVTVLDTGALTAVANVANAGWSADALLIVNAIGAGGAVECQGYAEFATAATTALSVNIANTAPAAADTTVPLPLVLTLQWSAASASNTITLRQMVVEVLQP